MKESKLKSGARYNTKSLQQSVKNSGGSVGAGELVKMDPIINPVSAIKFLSTM